MGQHHPLGKPGGPARIRQRDQVLGRVDRDLGGSPPASRSEANGVAPSASPYTKISSTPDRSAAAVALSTRSGTVTSKRAPESTSCAASSSTVNSGFAVVFTPPAPRHPVKRDRVLGQVGGVVREHVTLAEATLRQTNGQTTNGLGQLPIGDRPTARRVDQRRLVTVLAGASEHQPVNDTSGISTSGNGLRNTTGVPPDWTVRRLYANPAHHRVRNSRRQTRSRATSAPFFSSPSAPTHRCPQDRARPRNPGPRPRGWNAQRFARARLDIPRPTPESAPAGHQGQHGDRALGAYSPTTGATPPPRSPRTAPRSTGTPRSRSTMTSALHSCTAPAYRRKSLITAAISSSRSVSGPQRYSGTPPPRVLGARTAAPRQAPAGCCRSDRS